MTLALLAISAPAFAVDLTGDYKITITGGRSAYPIGAHGCITLTQTGDVLGFTNSGTAAARSKTGVYYAIKSAITVSFPHTVLSGVLLNRGLSYGTLTELSHNGGNVVGANSLTVAKGCGKGGDTLTF